MNQPLGGHISGQNRSNTNKIENNFKNQNQTNLNATLQPKYSQEPTYPHDFYHPGILEDSIRRNIDYNKVALLENKFYNSSTSQDDKPRELPTLIKYFDKKVSKIIEKRQQENELQHGPQNYKPNRQTDGIANHQNYIIPEGCARLSTTPMDLEQSSNKNMPKSDFEKAVNCLIRAQDMNDYYKKLRAAEEASRHAPPNKVEEAARAAVRNVRKTDPNPVDSTSTKIYSPNTYKPIEVICYTGITRPNNE